MEQKIKVNVPNSKAEDFAKEIQKLVNNFGGTVISFEVKDIFDKSKPIWERIKTVEDAIEYTGMTLPDCINELPIDVQAFMKLRIVVAAYNELNAETLNEFPKFERDEWRYWPWYTLYWNDELEDMSEEEIKEKGIIRVVLRSCNRSDSAGGVGCAACNFDSSNTGASSGSRLAFKSREAAIECGKRFAELWLDYCFLPKNEE